MAEELPYIKYIDKSITHAMCRTVIGRYYYYIFLKYRETLFHMITVENGFDVYKIRNIHILIQRTMTYYDRTDISGYLQILKDYRNSSDYDLTSVIDNNTINAAKLAVFYLEKEISSIVAGDKLNDAFNKALKEVRGVK
ncbi:MAG: hypothetical protein L7F77_02545 [Candidatus Magnetominusculus sp. LBB02]|nr:hypothetical protein [Candidatus Magnetominusculus sp. LBB02]